MLKIYERYPMINYNGNWEHMTIFGTTKAYEDPQEEVIHFKTFDELYAFSNNYITCDKTILGKRVCYLSVLCRDFAKVITEKNFPKEGISFKWGLEEVKHPTMEYLMKYLDAKDFIKYLKENGISFEKVLTNK